VKTTLRARTGVVAFAVLAACITPRAAATERTDERDGEIPVIRVIVDNEAQLALIPKGTVLPAGFQILSSREEVAGDHGVTSESGVVTKPLVFAYAPAQRFERLTVKETPAGADAEVVEFKERSLPETAAMNTENPCPAVFVVEVGPDIIHQVTCSYDIHPGRTMEQFRTFTSYPSTAQSSRIILGTQDPDGNLRSEQVISCPVSAGECTSGSWGYMPGGWQGWGHSSTASVRLPGGCTQDPPFCPFYVNTMVIPVVNP
jgi:hypothetical protein